MEYEELRVMEKTHVCAQCDGELVTRYSGKKGEYELVCGTRWDHHGYTRRLSQGELFQRGRANENLGPGAQKDLEKAAERGAPAFSKLPAADLATGEVIPGTKLLALITWGLKLGLKPHLGHVCLYHGKPYVTIDGYYYKNNKLETPYIISSRPLNEAELKEYMIEEGDLAWLAEARDTQGNYRGQGLGIVTREEIEGKSARHPEEFRAPVVHGHPQRMCEKRSEWQLLRKIIPLEEKE